jgi:hypothetical protein
VYAIFQKCYITSIEKEVKKIIKNNTKRRQGKRKEAKIFWGLGAYVNKVKGTRGLGRVFKVWKYTFDTATATRLPSFWAEMMIGLLLGVSY